MKIYCVRSNYPYLYEVLNPLEGKDLWLRISYNMGLNGNFYETIQWIKVISKNNGNYFVKFQEDNCYCFSLDSLDSTRIEKLEPSRILRLYPPFEVLTSEELVETHDIED